MVGLRRFCTETLRVPMRSDVGSDGLLLDPPVGSMDLGNRAVYSSVVESITHSQKLLPNEDILSSIQQIMTSHPTNTALSHLPT